MTAGQQPAECGGSGNSTEPHLHLQATDSLDWPSASGIAVELGPSRRVADGAVVERGMPRTGERIASV
ncbi:M23 family metallopeptidase [Agrococcus sp. KRD186]|uniref:M23 family metallopeptidase n=1 Tax=Agrococcus sp. KRD186 TaxID=2729730 RepID=UPI001F49FC26|nr:M23 family metallopeptidase [Agrococcus sp. KRD186]